MQSALELFSEHGFDRTSIGDLEEASGLSRRSGAFYRHFDSKRDVLEAVINRQVEENEQLDKALEMMPLGDNESEIKLFLRWGMELIDRGHKIYLCLLPLADQYPDLFQRMHDEIVERTYDTVKKWAEAKREQGVEFSSDPEILGMISVHAMVQYHQENTLFNELPADIPQDDYLDTLVDLMLGEIEDC